MSLTPGTRVRLRPGSSWRLDLGEWADSVVTLTSTWTGDDGIERAHVSYGIEAPYISGVAVAELEVVGDSET